jgi:hypothetical protein
MDQVDNVIVKQILINHPDLHPEVGITAVYGKHFFGRLLGLKIERISALGFHDNFSGGVTDHPSGALGEFGFGVPGWCDDAND